MTQWDFQNKGKSGWTGESKPKKQELAGMKIGNHNVTNS